MMTLLELIHSAPEDLQSALKKAFMPYSANIDVDGCEAEALTILLNLSIRKLNVKNFLDSHSAQRYFAATDNITKALGEIKWCHTHNLKYPDCRVKDPRILAIEQVENVAGNDLGWSHNGASYSHTIWLLNAFNWQGQSTSLLKLIQSEEPLWSKLLEDAGLSQAQQEKYRAKIKKHLSLDVFPHCVSVYSTQVRMPFEYDYISLTPVVNHTMQSSVQIASRDKESPLRFSSVLLPNSASIGNLCGSLGGRMQLIFAPSGCKPKPQLSLVHSKFKHKRFFDNYALTNQKFCTLLSHLIGKAPLKSVHARKHARRHQLNMLRKQIALWLMPLIELKESLQGADIPNEIQCQDTLIQDFLNQDEKDLATLASPLNLRIHETLQVNRFTHKFAYHPNLITAVKAQITWILQQLSAPLEEDAHQDEQYIYLSSMRAEQVNAVSSPYTVGVPSMTALYGFAHRFERQLQQALADGEDLKLFGFAFFIRSEYLYSSAYLTEPNRVTHKSRLSPAKRPTIRKSFYSDLVFDLVLKVKSSVNLKEKIDTLTSCLPNTFAGGVICPPLLSEKCEWIQVHHSRFVLQRYLNLLPQSGRWIIPVLERVSGIDEIKSAIDADSTQLPVAVGYSFLELPTERTNSNSPLHAYCENLLGIAKRVSPIDYRLAHRHAFFEQAFWQYKACSHAVLVSKSEENNDAIM